MSLFVVYKSALHGQQFPCQTGKGNRMQHLQIYQGLPVWRMLLLLCHILVPYFLLTLVTAVMSANCAAQILHNLLLQACHFQCNSCVSSCHYLSDLIDKLSVGCHCLKKFPKFLFWNLCDIPKGFPGQSCTALCERNCVMHLPQCHGLKILFQ